MTDDTCSMHSLCSDLGNNSGYLVELVIEFWSIHDAHQHSCCGYNSLVTMKTAKPERLFVFQCDKFCFTFHSHSQILSNLVRVGIDITLHELLLHLRGSIEVKSNANFLIILDVIYNHVEVRLFICFL